MGTDPIEAAAEEVAKEFPRHPFPSDVAKVIVDASGLPQRVADLEAENERLQQVLKGYEWAGKTDDIKLATAERERRQAIGALRKQNQASGLVPFALGILASLTEGEGTRS